MKERILIGEEQQIRFRLNGSQNAEVLCDMTRPLGTFLILVAESIRMLCVSVGIVPSINEASTLE